MVVSKNDIFAYRKTSTVLRTSGGDNSFLDTSPNGAEDSIATSSWDTCSVITHGRAFALSLLLQNSSLGTISPVNH